MQSYQKYHTHIHTILEKQMVQYCNHLFFFVLDLCVKGYHHILMQEIVKKEKGNMYYTKEGLELMGVDDDEKTDNK